MAPSTTTLQQRIAPPPTGGHLRDTALALTILNRVLSQHGSRNFAVRLWDGSVMPPDPGQEAAFTLILNRPGVLKRMFLPPNELALSEAYLDGDWDLEGDIVAAMRLSDIFEDLAMSLGDWVGLMRQVMALSNEVPHDRGNGRSQETAGRRRANFRGTEHSKDRDRQAVTYHYDVGNDFFSLFLGRRMIYSSAYFPTGQEDLDTAQEAKLEHTLRKLRLKPGERLLDIGCGWGGLITYAAERFGVEAVGITLSPSQAELATRRVAETGQSDRCRVMRLDYRDLSRQAAFDKIVSVGMVEHVGRAKLEEYFQAVWHALKPGGFFLNHGISSFARDRGYSNLLDRHVFQKGAFIRKYVFPDGELIPISEMLGYAELAGFEVRDVEDLREHYALTLRHWVQRLEARKAEALRQVDERTYRVWRLYMAGCSHAFSTARLSVHQCLLAKPDSQGRCNLPWSRADLYP